jgi:hypothetical protein
LRPASLPREVFEYLNPRSRISYYAEAEASIIRPEAAFPPVSPSKAIPGQDVIVEVVARVVQHAAAFRQAVADPDIAAGLLARHVGEILGAHGGPGIGAWTLSAPTRSVSTRRQVSASAAEFTVGG